MSTEIFTDSLLTTTYSCGLLKLDSLRVRTFHPSVSSFDHYFLSVDPRAITPLILTYNEEANIGRTLDQLTWAERIVIMDSYSTDGTLDIASGYSQVDVYQREFDHFADQCNYGLEQVDTEWVLSLDADYIVSNELVDEMRALPTNASADGYTASFVYCVFDTPLRGTLYPPRTVLYRRKKASYQRDGHAHHVEINGSTEILKAPIYHDDRKSLKRWLGAQERYVRAELKKYQSTPTDELAWPDRVRKSTWAPVLMFFYCLFGKGLILDGKAGWYYTFQRSYAELLLALALMDEELRDGQRKFDKDST